MDTDLALHKTQIPGTLVLTLLASPGQSPRVRAVELLGDGARMRMSFTRKQGLDDVLTPEAAETVRDIVSRAPNGTGVVVLPDVILRMKDLALGHARLIAAEDPEGARQFSIRFERVFGNLMSLFSAEVDIAQALDMQSAGLARLAHDSVFLPLYDFAEFLENAHDASLFGDRARLYQHLSETRDRIRALEDYHDVLRSLVDGEDNDAVTRLDASAADIPPPGTVLQ